MKRLNVKLAIWLVVLTLILVVGVHLLHAYQIERNADFLLMQAHAAKKDDNPRQAIKRYTQYLNYRPADAQAFADLASLVTEVAKQSDSTREDKGRALSVLEAAVRKHPELHDVRRELVDFDMATGRFNDAMEHIELLREAQKSDPALELKYARCAFQTGNDQKAIKLLFELIGLDPQTRKFKDDAKGAKEVDAYITAASYVSNRQNEKALADQIMDRMVELNKDSCPAYTERGRYRAMHDNFDDATKDLDRALELDPENLTALIVRADLATRDKDYEKAQKLIDRGLAKDPKSVAFYERKAILYLDQNKLKEAEKSLNEGLEKVPEDAAIQLIITLSDVQIAKRDSAGVRKTMVLMKDHNCPSELIDLTEGRTLVIEEKWLEASRKLEKVRPAMTRWRFTNTVDALLGQCYERLGQVDRSIEAFQRVLRTDPKNVSASVGLSRMLIRANRPDTSVLSDTTIEQSKAGLLVGEVLESAVAEEVRKPKENRDWVVVNKLSHEFLAQNKLDSVQQQIFAAKLHLSKGELTEARNDVRELLKTSRKYPDVWIVAARLIEAENKAKGKDVTPKDYERLETLVSQAQREIGDSAGLRLIRMQAALSVGGPDTASKLAALETDIDRFRKDEQILMRVGLASAYFRLRDYPGCKRCWEAASKLQPEDPRYKLALYELALEFDDEPTMTAMTKDLEQLLGPNDPECQYCAAARLVWQVRKQGKSTALLAQARKLLESAAVKRPIWGAVPQLLGTIAVLENNLDEAIEQLQRVMQLAPSGRTARQLALLLSRAGRTEEVEPLLESLRQRGDEALVERLSGELKYRRGDFDSAVADARNAVAEDPSNLANRLFLVRSLHSAGLDDEAEQVARETVEKDRKSGDSWLLLINQYIATGKKPEALEAVHEADKVLPPEMAPLVVGQGYELLGDRKQAEEHYLAALTANPDKLMVQRVLASFYISQKDRVKAKEYLDNIIAHQPAEGDRAAQEHVAWARRIRAQMLPQGSSYVEVQKALALIDANAVDGVLSASDKLVKANMLAMRADITSKQKAIELFESLRKQRGLTVKEQYLLALLYDRTNHWNAARDELIGMLTQSHGEPSTVAEFVAMLLKHNDLVTADQWLRKLQAVRPNSLVTQELRARLLAKQGKKQEAEKILMQLVPNPVPPDKLDILPAVARVLTDLELYPAAEKRLREYVELEPRGALDLAIFVGLHGNVEEAMAECASARRSQPLVKVIAVALEILRSRPEECTPRNLQQIEGWIKKGIDDLGDAQDNAARNQLVTLQRGLADLRDLQGRPEESVKLYRTLLARNDLTDSERAVIKNNLAFALTCYGGSTDADEPLRLIQEAIETLGPVFESLDTRALIRSAQGDAQGARDDINLVISDSPTANAYFHRAWIQSKADNRQPAMVDFKRALDLKLDRKDLTRGEQKMYDQLVEEFGDKQASQ